MLISLAGWLVGMSLGGFLGYACAKLARRLPGASTVPGQLAILAPWRTVVINLLLLAPFVPVFMGLGNLPGVVIVGLYVFVISLILTPTVLLEYWTSPPLSLRLLTRARSLAVAAPVIAALAFWVGGFGLGHLVWQWQTTGLPNVSALLASVLLSLVLDIALGLVQLSIMKRSSPA